MAALRLGLRTVTWEVAAFAALVTYLSSLGGGPLGADFESGEIGVTAMATLVQAYLLCSAIVATPLALAMEMRLRLLARLTTSERLFRRNFTESMMGMALLRNGSGSLEIVDVNDAPPPRHRGSPIADRADARRDPGHLRAARRGRSTDARRRPRGLGARRRACASATARA